MMPSIFTKIINGEIPCYKIAETENCFAFLDIAPLAKGHTLVITKKEIDYIFNVEDDLLAELTIFSKKVAKAVEKAVACKRIGIAVIGIEVPHTHIHLVPLTSVTDLDFSKPKLKPSAEELKLIQAEICKYL
jgi:histidine triad (HIT) family protein